MFYVFLLDYNSQGRDRANWVIVYRGPVTAEGSQVLPNFALSELMKLREVQTPGKST